MDNHKLSNEEFIEKAKKMHGNKYDYSETVYNGYNRKLKIICPEHGEFWQTAYRHLNGSGCIKCKGINCTEMFVSKAHLIHGDKYDYSKVNYINSRTKVCIICPEHGEFWQTPYHHINGKYGCKLCSNIYGSVKAEKTKQKRQAKIQKYNTESFIEKAKLIHGDKYDYSKVKYINRSSKVCITCPEHGEFWQAPGGHLRKNGCPKCAIEQAKTKLAHFIEKANLIHKNKYDYSKVEYVSTHKKVCIICPEHGEFWQTPHDHLVTKGCQLCVGNKQKTLNDFVKDAIKIHGYKYDYSKVNYVNNRTKVCIICPEHGEFWQEPRKHISQQRGCSYCGESHQEMLFARELESNNIVYEREKKFDNLIGVRGKPLRFDFYIPSKNTVVEIDGSQHYSPSQMCANGCYGKSAEENFKILLEHDRRKNEFCIKNGINLIRIKYTNFMRTYKDIIIQLAR